MKAAAIVNIGEVAFPLNDAIWAQSDHWTLVMKMRSDFSVATLERLRRTDNLVSLNAPAPPTQAIILGSNSGFNAFLIGNQSAGKALSISGKSLLLVGRKLRGIFRRQAH